MRARGTKLRSPAVVLAFAVLMAGCAKSDGIQGANAPVMSSISGVVTDPGLAPIAGATVTVDQGNATTTTDAAGAFRLSVPPGEWIVLASAPGRMGGALRAHTDAGAAVKLAFALPIAPVRAPHVEVLELKGLVSCGAALRNANGTASYACGRADPNERTRLKADAPIASGFGGAVVELVWTATTPASNRLALGVSAGSGEKATPLGEEEGAHHVAIVIARSTLESVLASGATELRFDVSPTGSLTDEEAAIDAGAAFQQPFTIYASYFYDAPPVAGYTALKAK